MFPQCESSFSAALIALDAYNETLAEWQKWLSLGDYPDNADKVLLHETLRTLQAKWGLEQDSEWASPLFAAFDQEMQEERARFDYEVNVAVDELAQLLDASGTIAEFNAIKSPEIQLAHADGLITALAASVPGMTYLSRIIVSTPENADTTPILHPDRLIRNMDGDFDITDPMKDHQDERPADRVRRLKLFQPTRRAVQLLATVYFDLLPAMLGKLGQGVDQIPLERFHGYLESFVEKCLPGTLKTTPFQVDLVDRGKVLVGKLRNDEKLNRGLYSETMGNSGASLLLVFEGLNLYYTYLDFMNSPPGTVPLGNLASDTAGMMNSIAALAAQVIKTKSVQLIAARLTIYTAVFTVWDLVMQLSAAAKARDEGSTEQGWGHIVQAVGHIGMVVGPCMIAKAVLAGSILIPVAGPIIATVGLALTLAGCILVEYFRPSDQLRWARNCYFGNNWINVSPGWDFEQRFFGFKRVFHKGNVRIEAPDIPGQISKLYHKGNPFQASITLNSLDPTEASLWLRPLAEVAGQKMGPDIPYTAGIAVKRIEQQSTGNYYKFLSIYHRPLATTSDPSHPSVVGGPGDKNEIVEFWSRYFTVAELSGGSDNFQPAGSWYEIDILPYVMRKHIQLIG
ncbi:MAG: hypothetical protein DIZ77_16710 [endosymbiont of Seepiophila jonesi]|uniref:Uncharacterized protein n=1 Tax=endosymbiont of Lamellibrachia luymesi TaxID=2200907 RepID=A0A370DZD9_9GAMM|nr:MAG: hypothetical protein DIZ77_16710 [endosymbiont of Seepiophila jonesi]RDH91946.1 MAG: hypothetical protein DIZ79_04770 [endosymbiont of Lamellibrachia luymesi]